MQPSRLEATRVTCLRALGAALVCCVILGGVTHAQAPQQGSTAPASAAPQAPEPDVAAPTPAAAAPPTDVAGGLLPRDLTPWGMFMSADIIDDRPAVRLGLT